MCKAAVCEMASAEDPVAAGSSPNPSWCVQGLGLPCTRWTPALYQELRQAGDGTATGMLKTFFNSCGWPIGMEPQEHEPHVLNILRLKDEALHEMLRNGEVPLRPGAIQSTKMP